MSLLTDHQMHLARHALGLPRRALGAGLSYRNRFLAAGADVEPWREMVKVGLAVEGKRTDLGSIWFFLTMAGAREVLGPDEKLDPEDFPEARGAAVQEAML